MKMKAVGMYKALPITDESSLVDVQMTKPVPTKHDLLVKIAAVSVNPVDTKLRVAQNKMGISPRILGFDAVGTIVGKGSEVTLFHDGEEVYFAGDVTRQGNNAEYTLIDERLVGHKPVNLTNAEAAAMPLTTITATEALFDRLQIVSGKSILIINGAGGVGSVATQLAKLAGLTVISTASRADTVSWTKAHGADYVINHHEDMLIQLQKLGFRSVDYILCLHDTYRHFSFMEQAIKPQGKICTIVDLTHPVDMRVLKDKSATLSFEFMFTRSKYQTEDQMKQHDILEQATLYFETGQLKSTLNKVLTPFNAETLRLAHQTIEEGQMIGKLVVEGFDNDGK
ncbi:zinc-dependent alcohol dehydrogenase [Listeria fleischmannii 1991]|nr:zinc-dependent alcohol dehydrogenase [Listeria fleischmannii 1991]